MRLHLVPGENLDLPASAKTFKKLFDDLSLLDGFGTTSQLFVTLDLPIDATTLPPSGDGSGNKSASVVFVNLDSADPEFVDFEWKTIVESPDLPNQTTLVLSPMVPLRPHTRYGLAITRALHPTGGGCYQAAPITQALLAPHNNPASLTRLEKRYGDLIARLQKAGTIAAATDLSDAIVFTTQHTVEDSVAIATDIRKHPIVWKPVDPNNRCPKDMSGLYRTCEGTILSSDYRKDHLYIDEANRTPQSQWTLPVVIYLPVQAQAMGAYRTILFGHGLGGDRHQAAQLAELAAPMGYATVAIDAVKHGDHPDKAGSVTGFNPRLDVILDFFGFSLSQLDSRKLRDNFRQSTYDKLQTLEMLRAGVDVDGDGKTDVGLDRFLYLGVSLGGIMAAEFLALAPESQIGVPIVPGARVSQIVSDGMQFAIVIGLFRKMGTDGDVARFFPLLQTAIDRGDSGAYVQHILRDRLPGFDARVPQVLMQMVLNDDTVPNSTNKFFARGLGAPQVGDELLHIGTVLHVQKLPLSANLDATHTAGVFQYDVVFDGMGPATKPASHGNVAANPVAITQTLHFIDTYFQSGVAEIIDPYRVLGIKM